MNLTTLDNVLWLAGLLGNSAILAVMLIRRRWRVFKFFFAWNVFGVLTTGCLFFAYRFGSRSLYAWIYWLAAFVDIALQVAVVFELAAQVFRSADMVSASTRRLLRRTGIVAAIITFGLACGVHPAAPSSLDAWEVRGVLFSTLLICVLFTLVVLASQRFGFGWQNHATGLGLGLTLWAILALVVDILHGYWGAIRHFAALEHIRMVAFSAAQLLWIVALWRNEPKKKPISPEMQDAILQVTDRVSYDLAKALGTRGKEFR